VSGKRNTVHVTAPQGGSTMAISPDGERGQRHWVRTAGAVFLGLIAIIGVVFALMQAQGWRF
jgi:hypothetical protein